MWDILHVSVVTLPGVPEDARFRSIAQAAKAVTPGDTVLIHDGVYREAVVIEKSGSSERPIRFVAAPMARVIVDVALI